MDRRVWLFGCSAAMAAGQSAWGQARPEGPVGGTLLHVAVLVDKILKGTLPGETPFAQRTKFAPVIRRRNAAALGLTIRPRVLVAADEVIE